jgi:hypothetical protein
MALKKKRVEGLLVDSADYELQNEFFQHFEILQHFRETIRKEQQSKPLTCKNTLKLFTQQGWFGRYTKADVENNTICLKYLFKDYLVSKEFRSLLLEKLSKAHGKAEWFKDNELVINYYADNVTKKNSIGSMPSPLKKPNPVSITPVPSIKIVSYQDNDINTVINCTVQKLDGFLSPTSFRLAKPQRQQDRGGELAHIAIMPTLHTQAQGYYPLTFYLDKSKQQAPVMGMPDNRHDVMDDLLPVLWDKSIRVSKILFSLHRHQIHHLVDGVIVIKRVDDNHFTITYTVNDSFGMIITGIN